MKNCLSIILLLALSATFTCTNAKAHGATKPRGTRPLRQHEVTNRMLHAEHRHREQQQQQQSGDSSAAISINNTDGNSSKKVRNVNSESSTVSELELHHVTEHNVHKNTDNKDEIPMESERLIHVTPKPMKNLKSKNHKKSTGMTKNGSKGHGHKLSSNGGGKIHHKNVPSILNKKKVHHRTNSSAASKPHHKHPVTVPKTGGVKVKAVTVHAPNGSKMAKPHRIPKKYNSKKHGWKKNIRKEKLNDKIKEKRDKREKKLKATHQALAKNI